VVQAIETCEDLVAQIDDIGVAATVKAHRKPPLLTRILRDLYDLYHDQDRYLSFLAHYPLIPSDLADQMANTLDSSKTEIAVGLAGNPRCPQQALHRLTKNPDVAVRHALATNPNLTPKEFQHMVGDQNPFVRAALAQNTSLPNPLQFVLADDPASGVRIALSQRKNLDIDVAVHLAASGDSLVRAATILDCNLDDELLQLWADQDHVAQQLLLLKRKKALPQSPHESLRYSPHGIITRNALKDSALSGPGMLYLAQSEDTRDRIFLSEQRDLPASIQRMLAQDASAKVRCRLAANASIQEPIALHIAASNDLGACRALGKNPATSDTALRELCLHPDDDIALLVAYRDDLAAEHYDLLINHRETIIVAQHIAYQGIEYNNFSEEVAEQLARHAAPTIRRFAAQSARLSEPRCSQLAQDPSPAVRQQLALNPSLSEQQLRALLEDTDRTVVFAAEANFAERIRRSRAPEPTEISPIEAPELRDNQPRKGALFNKIVDFFTE
jgi:hypothetical protein